MLQLQLPHSQYRHAVLKMQYMVKHDNTGSCNYLMIDATYSKVCCDMLLWMLGCERFILRLMGLSCLLWTGKGDNDISCCAASMVAAQECLNDDIARNFPD